MLCAGSQTDVVNERLSPAFIAGEAVNAIRTDMADAFASDDLVWCCYNTAALGQQINDRFNR